jgi:D-serine deaminase-like pyridoxal phosphate-dependent protein
MTSDDISTPALVIDAAALDSNLAAMAAARPGASLRPHVKAHKCTSLARRQQAAGHDAFTCATVKEVVGMARAGLGADLLLANEVVDPVRLAELAACQDDARITIAVDSRDTIDAAARAGLRACLVDVDVGLPRCGVRPDAAGAVADHARGAGLEVRGVMGYEGHLMMVADRDERRAEVEAAMVLLARAHADVGGDIVSAGGTGTHDLFAATTVTEVQAGSYALMDSHYGSLGLPFAQAAFVVGTVISASEQWAVADVGLKALGMDHGNPTIAGATVWFCSDEHITFQPTAGIRLQVGDRVRVVPAHIDPTMAMHEAAWLVDGEDVIERWPIDLRNW